jgi:hypothetical protein
MINLSSQPFLSSLVHVAEQPGNYAEYRTLLQEEQSAFLEYVQNCFDTAAPAQKHYLFLRTADIILNHIHLVYSEDVRKNSADFYRFWAQSITETRQFLSIYVETLKFEAKCPAYMLAEPEPKPEPLPPFVWMPPHRDLMEFMTGVFQTDAIRLPNGKQPTFTYFVNKFAGGLFGITFAKPHDEMDRVLSRKRDQTPFFNRIIACLKKKGDRLDA